DRDGVDQVLVPIDQCGPRFFAALAALAHQALLCPGLPLFLRDFRAGAHGRSDHFFKYSCSTFHSVAWSRIAGWKFPMLFLAPTRRFGLATQIIGSLSATMVCTLS